MQQLQIPCDAVCFEITESVLAPNAGNQVNILKQFRKAGCDIAIDDFGTGYSSLSYLRQFPANIIKIDRSFISGDSKDETDWALVESIIAMAHVLHLDVVAEGIETELQLQRLAKLGCDYIQGYHISRPLPADQLLAFIEGFSFNYHWVNKECTQPKLSQSNICQCGGRHS
jgi:EAL domain-containing protein (putative c-di-GMP-specific phosphodiesterase class I)